MEIKIGNIYKNKTWNYFAPILNYYGKALIGWINTTHKLAVGVGDNNHINPDPSVYLLFDAKYQPQNFEKFLSWVRYQDFYVVDYLYSSDLKDGRKHMVVLTVPEPYVKTYYHLLAGEYSKMFTSDQIKGLFGHERKKDANVLSKKPIAYTHFINKLNEEFKSNVDEDDFDKESIEFDLPFRLEEEVFNYPKMKEDDYSDFGKEKFW
tara:strand:+ start:46477 stop:47097 length:621 start_codon:yes stop_codon:yes gene_type:complete